MTMMSQRWGETPGGNTDGPDCGQLRQTLRRIKERTKSLPLCAGNVFQRFTAGWWNANNQVPPKNQ